MNLNNKYFARGLLFVLVGILFLLWSLDIIRISVFGIFNFALAIALIYYGEKYVRFVDTKSIGRVMISLGVVLMIYNFGIPMKFILAVIFLAVGFYFLFVKSKVFTTKKGVFKDSRNDVYVKEICSSVVINHTAENLSSAKLRAYFSDITLDFVNSRIVDNNSVNFEVRSFFSNIRINTNSTWNVIVNGQYIRKIEGSYKVVNVKCSNLFSVIDIT